MKRTPICLSVFVLALSVMSLSAKTSMAGGNGLGDRLVMVTYWGEDKVALVDIKGKEGAEEVWVLDVYSQDGCAKPYDVKVELKRALAYVSCSGSNEIAVIDIIAQLVSHKIRTGSSPRDIALTSDGSRAVVANSGNYTVSVINTETGQTIFNVEVGNQPYGVALAKNDKLALVTGWASGELHFIELEENQGQVIKTIKIGLLPYTVVVPPVGNIAYVSVNAEHSVVAINIDTMEIMQGIRVGRNPWGLGVGPDGNVLVVANNRSADVSVLRGNGRAGEVLTEANRINVGSGGRAEVAIARAAKNAAVAANNITAVVTDLANNDLLVINLESGIIERVIRAGRAPYGIDFVR